MEDESDLRSVRCQSKTDCFDRLNPHTCRLQLVDIGLVSESQKSLFNGDELRRLTGSGRIIASSCMKSTIGDYVIGAYAFETSDQIYPSNGSGFTAVFG